MENLTEKVLHYQRTGQGLGDIVNDLAPRVYHFPRRTMGWDEDACGEFYVFVHPRILRLVERFRNQGKPFESYLWAVLSWQVRNFARERGQREREWRVSLRMDPGEQADCGPADAPGRAPAGVPVLVPPAVDPSALPCTDMARAIRSPADRRNFLFLVLKCSRQLDSARAPQFAAMAGVNASRLLDLVDTLRDMRTGRERRLQKFASRRNRAFAKILLLQTELRNEVEAGKIDALREALRRARQRMRSSAAHMARVGMSPTNREIAAVLGIPKGTVDSGLYWLKRKLAAVYDPDHLRSA
jgi:DNA-directed RNA polymerase specialized sigma24 family protein